MPADSTPPANGFDQPLNAVLNTAPELTKSPGLAVGVAQAGGNVAGNSQAVAHATNVITDTNATQSLAQAVGGPGVVQSALDWFGNHVVAPVAAAGSVAIKSTLQEASPILNVMNKPMQLVQHEYRYLHDVEATHGPEAAMLEGIGIAAGAVAGGLATGSFYGAELGAEGATGIESQLFYHDSWDRTGQASYADPNTHQQVSIGRDIISAFGLSHGSLPFKITSGLIDGVFDMNVGGTELLGLAGKANSAAGLGGTLGSYFPGKAPQTTEAFDNLMTSFSGTNVRRAFSDIASKSPGEIASAYPALAQQSALTTLLGNAKTEEEVQNVFRDIVRTHEMVYFDKMPTLSAIRAPLGTLRDAMGNSSVPGVQRLFKATSRLPTSYDDVAHEWTNAEFNPSGADDGTLFVHRTALYTENQRVAASISEEYANADLPGKVRIWKNLVWTTLANMAGYRGVDMEDFLKQSFSDPKEQQMWREAINNFVDTGMFGKDAKYGTDVGGDDISKVRDMNTGNTFAAGITMNQTGNLSGLDLMKARRAAATLAQQKNYMGKFDDFAFDHITAPVFKRFVLLSPSYALHISLAELIPNSLRLGLVKVAKAKLELHLANTGIKLEDGEANAVAGTVYKMFKGIRHLTPGVVANPTERDLNYLTDFIVGNDGHLVSREVGAGHNLQDEIKPRQETAVDLQRGMYFRSGKKKLGDDFGTFGIGDQQYHDAWQARLHESANDGPSQLAAQKLLEYYGSHNPSGLAEIGPNVDVGMNRVYDEVAAHLRDPNTDTGAMMRSMPHITTFLEGNRPPNMDQYDEWARTVVAKVRGETTGVDGTIHTNLLQHIVNGETTDAQELQDILPKSKPRNVTGRLPLPNGDQKLQRIANWGFRRVLNPMVNYLSREPIEAAEYLKQRNFLQKSVDDGIRTDEEAHVQAMAASVQNVIKNVHNLTDRTQWTATFRNWAPFYFAQEQAYRRMGRLLAENPAAFRKYQLMITNMHDVGQVFQGPGGQGYFVMPGTGWMTGGMVKALSMMGVPIEGATPVGMGWNLSSSSVIFPLSAGVRPDIGPLVSTPVSALAQYFPSGLSPILKADLTSAADGIIGPTATESVYMQMIPNTIAQRLLTAAFPTLNSRAFNSTMMQTLATLDYENKIPPPTADYRTMQTFLDRVRLQTQIMYAAKGIFGAFTPVSPELTDTAYNQFTSEVATAIVKNKSVSAGLQEFLSAHPDATPYTVWQSSNLTGVSIPSSIQAEHWINENLDLIDKYPNAGILLMPMTGISTTYNPAVYNEQIAQGLRAKLSPDQYTQNGNVPSYIDSLYIAAGNSIFFKWLNQYETQIKGLTGTMKYDAEQAFWGNGSVGPIPPPTGTIGKFGQQNPVWYNWFLSQTREVERGQAINQMTQLLKDNPGLHTPIADGTRSLLEGYQNYTNQVTTLTNEGAASAQKTDAEQNWKTYLINTATQYPEMVNVITGLFMSIPTTSPQVNISNTSAPGVFNAQSWRKAS
jgi:hypothetical protein